MTSENLRSSLPVKALSRSQLTEGIKITQWDLLSLIYQSHIFHKHYLPATVSGLGQRPQCWFSNIGCEPDQSGAMGHILNTCSISDGLMCWIYWEGNGFPTHMIKKKSPKGKYSWRDCRRKPEATEVQLKTFWPYLGFSRSVVPLFHDVSKLCSSKFIHSFVKDEDAFFLPDALRGLCGSEVLNYFRLESRPCGGKALCSSCAVGVQRFNLPASDFQPYTSAKEFCWQEGPLTTQVQLSFNGPFAQTESKSDFWKAIGFLQVKHSLSCLLMLSLQQWLLWTKRKSCQYHFENRANDTSIILALVFGFQLELNIKKCICDQEGGSGPLEKWIFSRFHYTERLRWFSISIKLSQSGYVFKCRSKESGKRQPSFLFHSLEKS